MHVDDCCFIIKTVFNVLIKLSDTLTNASALMNHLDSDIILIISLF